MKTVMGIPKTAKHPTKKGEKAMSGTGTGWFADGKRIPGRPGGRLWKDSRTYLVTWPFFAL